MPAAVRGAMEGGSAGLIGGLIGVVVPPIGLTIAGVAATTLVGAAVGSWVTALIGSMVPDEVHRRFESEIRAGRILIVVDETPGTMRSEEHTSELQSLMRISYAVFRLKTKNTHN